MKVCGMTTVDLIEVNPIIVCTICKHIPSIAFECNNCHKIVGNSCIAANCTLCGSNKFRESVAANAFIKKLKVTHMPCKEMILLSCLDEHRKTCEYKEVKANMPLLIASQLIKEALISSGIKEESYRVIEGIITNMANDSNLEIQTYKETTSSLKWSHQYNNGMKLSKSQIKCRAISPTFKYSTILAQNVYP